MKRIALLLVFGFSITLAFAQGTQKPFSHYLEQKQELDEDLQKPKKEDFGMDFIYKRQLKKYNERKVSPDYWNERGTVFRDIDMYAGKNLGYGTPKNTALILKGEPEKKLKQGSKEIWQYPSMEIIYENEKVVKWKLTADYEGQPYDSAMHCYTKAFELDEDGSERKNIRENLVPYRDYLWTECIMKFSNEDVEGALTNLRRSANIYNMPEMEGQDTTKYNIGLIYFYGGQFATKVNKLKVAENFYKNLLAYNKEVKEAGEPKNVVEEKNAYRFLAVTYRKTGQTEKQKNILDKAYEKFGDDKNILLDITQYYLDQGEFENSLEFLNKSLEKDPDNPQYIYVKGSLYDNFKQQKYNEMDSLKAEVPKADSLRKNDEMTDKEYVEFREKIRKQIKELWEPANKNMNKAADLYKKALELKEDYSDARYNLGALYYNKAAQVLSMAALIPTNEQELYDKRKKLSDELFKKAKPYIKQAKEEDPYNVAVLQTLSTIYAKLAMYDKVNELKAEIEKAKQKQKELK